MDGNKIIRYGNDKRACCVPHCTNYGNFYKDGKKIGYFTFPTKEPEKSIWMERCQVATLENFKPRTSFVCTEHFDEDEIEYFPFSNKWRRKKPDAVPNRFDCWTDSYQVGKTEPADVADVGSLVAPTASTLVQLKLPDALGVRPDFTDTLGMLSTCTGDTPTKDPGASLDLEALIENPVVVKEEPSDDGKPKPVCIEPKPVRIEPEAPRGSLMSRLTQSKKPVKVTFITLPSSAPPREASPLVQIPEVDSSEMNLKISDVRTETVPHSVLMKQAEPVGSDNDEEEEEEEDSDDSDDDTASWMATRQALSSDASATQPDSLNSSSSVIDVNAILASANNASSILSAAINTTTSSLSQDDLADKIQRRIQKATCVNCSAMFLDPRDLAKHIISHKKTLYACEICSEKFPTVFLLKKHSRVHQAPTGAASGRQSHKSLNVVQIQRNAKRKRDDDDDPDFVCNE